MGSEGGDSAPSGTPRPQGVASSTMGNEGGDSAPSGTPRPQGVASSTMGSNVRALRPRPAQISSREVLLGNARILIDEDPRTAQAVEELNRNGFRFLHAPEDTRGRSLRPLPPGHEGAERLQVFWEGAMGLGLKTLSPIPTMGIVGEYTGRQVGEEEKQASTSLYIMGTGAGGVFLDAESGGNLTRFINHHCPHGEGPNTRSFVVDGCDERIVIEALRPIEAGEILSLDYGPDYAFGQGCRCAAPAHRSQQQGGIYVPPALLPKVALVRVTPPPPPLLPPTSPAPPARYDRRDHRNRFSRRGGSGFQPGNRANRFSR
jgi:SET domain-containing protein